MEFVEDIFQKINQRKETLHLDSEVIPVGNKILSRDFKNIKGVSEHLEQMRKIHCSLQSDIVNDPKSHGYISRAELRQQFTTTGKNRIVRKGKTISS